jgi:hypothetical protein
MEEKQAYAIKKMFYQLLDRILQATQSQAKAISLEPALVD